MHILVLEYEYSVVVCILWILRARMLLVASSDKEFLHPYIFEFLLLSRSTLE